MRSNPQFLAAFRLERDRFLGSIRYRYGLTIAKGASLRMGE